MARGGERGEHDPGLRARHDRDLALGIELDAVVGAVALGDRGAQVRVALERRVAVDGDRAGLERRLPQRRDRVGRRRQVGVAPAEVDEPRAGRVARGDRGGEDPREVLLGQAVEERRLAHDAAPRASMRAPATWPAIAAAVAGRSSLNESTRPFVVRIRSTATRRSGRRSRCVTSAIAP